MKKSLLQATVCVLLLGAWFLLTAGGMVHPLIIPTPYSVGKATFSILLHSDGWSHILSTCGRFFLGFLLGSFAGIVVGTLLARIPSLNATTGFVLDFFRSIPATALIPLYLLIFGLTEISKIALISTAVFFIMTINTRTGVWHIEKTRIWVAHTLEISPLRLFCGVFLLDAYPHISAGIRLSLSFALILTIVSEMFIGTSTGLGSAILENQLRYETATMYGYIFITGMLGYLANFGYGALEKLFLPWVRFQNN